jgi:hypothetical protein
MPMPVTDLPNVGLANHLDTDASPETHGPTTPDDIRAGTVQPYDMTVSSKSASLREALSPMIWDRYVPTRRARALSDVLARANASPHPRASSLPPSHTVKPPFLLRNRAPTPSTRSDKFFFDEEHRLPAIPESVNSLDLLAAVANSRRAPLEAAQTMMTVPSSPLTRDEWDTTDVEADTKQDRGTKAGRGKMTIRETMTRIDREIKEELVEAEFEKVDQSMAAGASGGKSKRRNMEKEDAEAKKAAQEW